MVFAEDCRALTTWSSTKKKSGRRYRYYISIRDTKEYSDASGLPRIPAAELESAVVEQIRGILKAPPVMQQVSSIVQEKDHDIDETQVTVALNKIDNVWEQLFPDEQSRIIKLMIEKIIVKPDNIDIWLWENGIERLVLEITDSAKQEVA